MIKNEFFFVSLKFFLLKKNRDLLLYDAPINTTDNINTTNTGNSNVLGDSPSFTLKGEKNNQNDFKAEQFAGLDL